ncbi:MAG: ribbon-helix-helix protein, CopG family [Deltaproteobacteria bacterium]|nr:ribbon-helix-helix protein, CopG family [Deltaproteobacteria bacterium]
MKRTQVQLDEEDYEVLRRKAFLEKKSISGLIREIVRKEITHGGVRGLSSIKDFRFIGSGRSSQGKLRPASVHHDEALEEAIRK